MTKPSKKDPSDGVSMPCALGETIFTAPKKKADKPITAQPDDGQEAIGFGCGCSIKNTKYRE